jgi:hypothetical protein
MMVQENVYAQTETLFQLEWSEPRTKIFEEFVLSAIEECLSSLGESTKQAMFLHLTEHHNLNPPEIPSRIRDFTQALEESYGQAAKLIEIELLKILHRKMPQFKYFLNNDNLSLAKYVESLRYFF